MYYMLCRFHHVNIVDGDPGGGWICGACGSPLHFNRFAAFAYTGNAVVAIASPEHAQPIPQQELAVYDGFAQRLEERRGPQPQAPTLAFGPPPPSTSPRAPSPTFGSTSGFGTLPSSPGFGTVPPPGPFGFGGASSSSSPVPYGVPSTSFGAPSASATQDARELMETHYEELVEPLPQEQARISEAQSQELLYGVLESNGFLFLRRNGSYGPYKKPVQLFDPEETVPEPGMLTGGQITRHIHMSAIRVGRLEDETPRGRGTVTYPDYLAQKKGITYSIELKTPWNTSFKEYLSQHFYDEKVFTDRSGGSRSIVDEIEARKRLTPSGIYIAFLFDLRNVSDADQAVTDLKNSINASSDVRLAPLGNSTEVRRQRRREWWTSNVFGVMFYTTSGLSKIFTVDEISGGAKLQSRGEQGRLDTFFKKK